ncbi:MAG: HAD-IC family P-type ATPase, partial [Candidatus Heimdallarchaeota archaeon]|nr:HAD-IC family P-type ATPase [Candidatus Heimdallarchaeota archaeon]
MSLDIPERGHELILSEIVSMLNSKSDVGLSESEASARLVKYGANEIQTKKPSIWRLYFAPLFDTLIVIYLIITGIMVLFALIAALGFIEDVGFLGKTVFWLVIISFNIIMAIYQQYRAQKQLAALQQLTSPKSKVVRNGNVIEISSQDLVPGDLIELELGNKIPADCRVITSSNLTVNEASLTGESIPVAKVEDGSHRIDIDASIAQHFNMLYLGTFVQTGTAKAIVIHTGNSTEIGKIASAMNEMQTFDIPLRNRVNKLGKLLGITMIIFLLVIFTNTTYNRLQTGDDYTLDFFAQDMVISIINAMAVMPINIPLMTTLVLITGVLHMAQKKVIIKELSSVETLGRISVLCSDKTGTITTGNMTSKLLWDTESFYTIYPDSNIHVSLSPIPESEILHTLEDQDYDYPDIEGIENGSSLELLLTAAILNNEANLVRKKAEHYNEEYFEIIGNPTDGALLVLASTHGLQENY